MKNAAIMARVHATASRRAFVTSPSYVDDRSRITFDVASYSSNTAMICIRKTLRDRFGMDAKWARISAPINVNSGEGGGISSLNDGGIKPRSIASTPTERTPLRAMRSRTVKTGDCKAKNAHPVVFSTGRMVNDQPSDTPRAGAVGREASPPARLPAGPFPSQQEKAGSTRPSLFPIVRGQPSQGCRRISVLRHSRPFAAVGSPQVFVGRNPDSPLKAYPDYVAHRLVSKSSGRPKVQSPCT